MMLVRAVLLNRQIAGRYTQLARGTVMGPVRQHTGMARVAGKGRRKGRASAKALRQAVARRKLEQRREEQYLQEQIYDVFSDEG
jgi:hypothetical protein